jgi:hypothetical protein
MHGFAIPYVVWHGIPIDTIIAMAISYALIATSLYQKRNNKDAVSEA